MGEPLLWGLPLLMSQREWPLSRADYCGFERGRDLPVSARAPSGPSDEVLLPQVRFRFDAHAYGDIY